MGGSGTLNFSYSLDAGVSVGIVRNGVNLGQVSSCSVSNGDMVYMTASASMSLGSTKGGTITVSGLYSDSIAIYLERSTGG